MLVFFWIIRGSVDFQLLANRPLKKNVIYALLHARCYFFALVSWFIEYILFRSHWLEVNHNFFTYQAPYFFPAYENFAIFLCVWSALDVWQFRAVCGIFRFTRTLFGQQTLSESAVNWRGEWNFVSRITRFCLSVAFIMRSLRIAMCLHGKTWKKP